MNERTMRFRIGLFVLLALVLMGTLVVLFSAVPAFFRGGTPYTILFTEAPGIGVGMPVRRSGVRIGEVRSVRLDEDTAEVVVGVIIDPPYRIRRNEVPTLITGLLTSDTNIELVPRPQPEGQPPLDRSPVPPGEVLRGERGASVSALLARASDVVPTTQETLNDIRKSLRRFERMAPLVEDTLREYRELGKAARETVPELRKTNSEIQELARATRETIPDARRAINSLNEAIPDARRLMTGLNESIPDARKAINAFREAIPDARRTMDDIGAASRNVGKLSERVDVLIQTNQDKIIKSIDNLNEILQRTASLLNDENLRAINATIRNTSRASERLGDIALQTENAVRTGNEAMKEVHEAVKDSRLVIRHSDETLTRLDEVLKNMQEITKPLAERGAGILRNIDETTDRFNRTLGDVRELFKVLDQSDGTLRKFLTDPSLYNHLDEAACQVSRIIPRLDRILKDFETFADKLARHPEAIGIGGVVRPGTGLKDPPTPPGAFRH